MTSTIKPEQIRWRVGQVSKKDSHKGMLLGYIDSRTAMELLDDLDAEWSDAYQIVKVAEAEGIECSLTVKGVTRTDVGVPSNTEGLKGAYSDALKRAAVKHGIGRELYELPRIWVTLDDYKRPTAEPTYRNGRWTLPSGSGSVFYDHEPTEQPQGGERAEASGSAKPATTRPAVQPSRYRRDELAELMADQGLDNDAVEVIATAVGIPRAERPMSDESMDKLIDAIRESSAIETPAAARAAGEDVAPASEELSDAGVVPSPGAPPQPGTDEYKALPAAQKASARAYWQEHAQEPETLAEQLQVPA